MQGDNGSGEDAEEETYFCAARTATGVNTAAIPKEAGDNFICGTFGGNTTAMKMKKSFANITIRERMTSKFSAVLEIIIWTGKKKNGSRIIDRMYRRPWTD